MSIVDNEQRQHITVDLADCAGISLTVFSFGIDICIMLRLGMSHPDYALGPYHGLYSG